MSARVLVVDDERLIRWGLCRALKDAGYVAEQAGTTNEAIETVERDMPDLLLLDYKLPDGSGIDVLRAVRRASPRTPVVMITAHASVGGALETGQLREELARSREDARAQAAVENIVAHSPAMQEVVRLVRRIAESEASTI